MNRFLRISMRLCCTMPNPLQHLLAGSDPSVLLYHGTPRKSIVEGKYRFDKDVLEQQIVYLKKHFEFLHPREIGKHRSCWDRKGLLLTFDDGLRNNASVAASILLKHHVPAIFFVCSRNLATDQILWFSYLRALEIAFSHDSFTFRGENYDMSASCRKQTLKRLREYLLGLKPHPQAMYSAIENELPPWESFLSKEQQEDWFAGLTEDQVKELASRDIFSVECHTVDHPFLTKCDLKEAIRQIDVNRRHIEQLCQTKVTTISYPLGDYNRDIIASCREIGFQTGYAVRSLYDPHDCFEIPRAGIYQPYKDVARFKALWSRRRPYSG